MGANLINLGLRPLVFLDSIVCLNFHFNIFSEHHNMTALTIEGLKRALNYVQDNNSITYYEVGPRKGLMVTDQMSEEDAYHMRIIQSLEPRLIARLAEQYTLLSLDGQELLHMLNDDRYLDSLRLQLQRDNGYSNPADVQIFKMLRKQLDGSNPVASWPDVIKLLIERSREKVILPDVENVASLSDPAQVQKQEVLPPEVKAEQETDAARIIKGAKQNLKKAEA
jgi:hypothetical protein